MVERTQDSQVNSLPSSGLVPASVGISHRRVNERMKTKTSGGNQTSLGLYLSLYWVPSHGLSFLEVAYEHLSVLLVYKFFENRNSVLDYM